MTQIKPQSPMLPVPFLIKDLRWETHDTFTWELEAADGETDFHFSPGQFNMLYVFGVGEIPISISGRASDTGKLIHTIRVVGTVTRAMKALQPGAQIGLRGPFGTDWPVKKAKGHDLLLLAGGIGMAPLRPVVYHALEHPEEFGKVTVIYGARTPDALLFQDELKEWEKSDLLDLDITVDLGLDGWTGHVGVITKRMPHATFDPNNTIAMMCGPEIMMHFCVEELKKVQFPESNIYLSMERNMKCAVGWCGHCQFGPSFVCKDGPVYDLPTLRPWLAHQEL